MNKLGRRIGVAVAALAGAWSTSLFAADPAAVAPKDAALRGGDIVAICGDSITEQKQYSAFIEDYLLMCQPAKMGQVVQFGWSGETAEGFGKKMDNDWRWLKPTVATTCYGMNDGHYAPMTDKNAAWYHDNLTKVVKDMKDNGVRLIVLGTSGPVDTYTFRRPKDADKSLEVTTPSTMYNATLLAMHDVARTVAGEQGVVFADLYTPMMDAMGKAKAKYGVSYHVCGPDGVHPAKNGHLIMAYAFLKALGCDGNIGTITVDLGANTAEATDGHKVLGAKDGVVEVESTRYPFVFTGEKLDDPNSTRGIVSCFPFNQDLNRFMLVVKNAKAAKYKVTWGTETKTFSADDLAKGINLAAEFLDSPFADAFKNVDSAVHKQQNLETSMVKDQIHNHKAEADDTKKKDMDLWNASQKALEPVKHTVKIEAVQ